METIIVIYISPTNVGKFWVSSYGPKCCQPIKLQDSLKCNIIRKKRMMKFIFFCMQINIEVFCKMILSFWVSLTSHSQSTQNKFAYLCNISIKTCGIKLIFRLQINTEVFYKMIVSRWVCLARQTQSTKNKPVYNIFVISQGKHEGWRWFLPADKCWRFFQIDTITLGVCDQASPNYLK